jgi:hypothetical protein
MLRASILFDFAGRISSLSPSPVIYDAQFLKEKIARREEKACSLGIAEIHGDRLERLWRFAQIEAWAARDNSEN